ncbi:hypothetical protein CHUAL_000306 [Chamberlinius hualienensis]
MAWSLVNQVDSTKKIFLLCEKDYVIGRKTADINLQDDISISRVHAVIRINYSTANIVSPQKIPSVTIKDSSKYGTVINGRKLNSDGMASLLNNNDIIQFGVFDNIWKVIYTPFICATSGLSKTDKRKVAQNILLLGGHIMNEWTEACTHLIMNKIFMTMKVVNALVSQSPILMPKYIADAVDKKAWPSDIKAYEPPIDSCPFYTSDANFQAEPKRQSVLSGKMFFVFSPRQEAKIKCAVLNSGGKVRTVDLNGWSDDDVRNDDSCFLEPPKEMKNNSFSELTNRLKRYGRRFISEGEIGLAILLCSTVQYCNPKSNEGALKTGSLPDTQFPNLSITSSIAYSQTITTVPTENVSSESSMLELDDLVVVPKQPTLTLLSKQSDSKQNIKNSEMVVTTERVSDESSIMEVDDLVDVQEKSNPILAFKKSKQNDTNSEIKLHKKQPNVEIKVKQEREWIEEQTTNIPVSKKNPLEMDIDDRDQPKISFKRLKQSSRSHQHNSENFLSARKFDLIKEVDDPDERSYLAVKFESMVRKHHPLPEQSTQEADRKYRKVFIKVQPKRQYNHETLKKR